MCKFFSVISDGTGKIFYFDWKQRKEIMNPDSKRKPEYNKVETADSHSSIASFYGFVGEKADKVNKYEFNPLTDNFHVDQINVQDDRLEVATKCRALDFNKIVKPLIVKPIIHPFKLPKRKPTKNDLLLLKKWKSVRKSVENSVENSAWESVWKSVRKSAWKSAWESVWKSVENSAWESVWDSVWAYVSSFFKVKYDYDFSPAVKLWERGLVPSFDGEIWRLHSGENADIVWQGKL